MRTALHLLFLLALAAVPGLSKKWQSDPDTCGRNYTGVNLMIKGGNEAPEHAWPWQVGMYFNGSCFCGGSLIDPWWVITAAHCGVLCFQQPFICTFKMGTNSRTESNSDTQWNLAERNYIHPNYSMEHQYDNDIALFKMLVPFNVTEDYTVNTVCLPTKEMEDQFKVGDNATVTGWGQLENGTQPDRLYEVLVPIFPWEGCYTYWYGGITKNMMCTWRDGVSFCRGDSGGPLVTFSTRNTDQYYLIGIVSWGYVQNCSLADYRPDVYTSVTRYEDWIRSIAFETEPTRSEMDQAIISGLSVSLAILGIVSITLGLFVWWKSRSNYSGHSLQDPLVRNDGYGSTQPI